MELNQDWKLALKEALKSERARSQKQIELADPWKKALACCCKAQKIRSKRKRNPVAPTTKKVAKEPTSWKEAIQAAIRSANERMKRHLEKGTWKYALKLKLTSLRLRAKEQFRGRASDQQR